MLGIAIIPERPFVTFFLCHNQFAHMLDAVAVIFARRFWIAFS
jgi:hypothetical protein